MTPGVLSLLERDFELSISQLNGIVRDFHLEMDKGLSGAASCLKMIPSYAGKPTGDERGEFIALDLGGTHFRVLGLALKGRGTLTRQRIMKFKLREQDVSSTGKMLFKSLASAVKKYIRLTGKNRSTHIDLGFTFSFPVAQERIDSGKLVLWTKGFSASGVEGRDVVKLLSESLKKEGIDNVSVSALVNDTVGTLAYRSYSDRACDIGVIIGTGTNACYVEALRNIKKLKVLSRTPGSMIINIEWGNFNKLKVTRYDRLLHRESDNPGEQMLEKMVSGMYLGEICRLIIEDLISGVGLLGGKVPEAFRRKTPIKSEFVSGVLSDESGNLSVVRALLQKSGVKESSLEDRKIVKRVCEIVSVRAARISAAVMVAVVTKMDPDKRRRHTIAIDGSVYEKLPGFSRNIRKTMRELSGRAADRIKFALTKDGSGYGAAIIAAAVKRLRKGVV